MDQKKRKPEQQNTERKTGKGGPNVAIVPTAESEKNRLKGAEGGGNPTDLHKVSRWPRFKRWLFTATSAEVGMFLLTLVIAGSSIYYTKYAKRQWKVMRDQLPELQKSATAADLNARLAQLEERAWFGTSETSLIVSRKLKPGEMPPLEGDFLEAKVEFLNTGKTPALNVRIATNGFVSPITFGPNGEQYIGLGFPQFRESDYQFGGNVPPNGAIFRKVRIWPQKVTKGNIIQLQKPTHRAFVAGRGTYCDVSNPEVTHWFTFCLFYFPVGDTPSFAVYPQFNDLGDEKKPCHAK